MYQNNNLKIPRLVPLNDLVLQDNDLNSRMLYRLIGWHEPDRNELPQLPAKYEKFMDSQYYAITAQYMQEITRTVAMGQMERNISRPFDTAVRDFCDEPSRAFFGVAFRLIADCVVNPKTFKRPDDRLISQLPRMMLYRFWQYQTGCGLPWFFSGMDDLESWVAEGRGLKDLRHWQNETAEEFLKDMKDHDRAIMMQHQNWSAKCVARNEIGEATEAASPFPSTVVHAVTSSRE